MNADVASKKGVPDNPDCKHRHKYVTGLTRSCLDCGKTWEINYIYPRDERKNER